MTQFRRLAWRRGYQLGRDPGERLIEELEQDAKAEAVDAIEEFRRGAADGWADRPPETVEAGERKRREAEYRLHHEPLPSIVRRP
jgi:hypothetical protein